MPRVLFSGNRGITVSHDLPGCPPSVCLTHEHGRDGPVTVRFAISGVESPWRGATALSPIHLSYPSLGNIAYQSPESFAFNGGARCQDSVTLVSPFASPGTHPSHFKVTGRSG